MNLEFGPNIRECTIVMVCGSACVQAPWVTGVVYSNCKGVDVNLDFHKIQNYGTLHTQIQLGACLTLRSRITYNADPVHQLLDHHRLLQKSCSLKAAPIA
jgi:hypothetical protein